MLVVVELLAVAFGLVNRTIHLPTGQMLPVLGAAMTGALLLGSLASIIRADRR